MTHRVLSRLILKTKLFLLVAFGFLAPTGSATASVIINLTEDSSGVYGEAFGHFDLAGITPSSADSSTPVLFNLRSVTALYAVLVGSLDDFRTSDVYATTNQLVLPGGLNGLAFADMGSGFKFGAVSSGLGNTSIFVDSEYVSGQKFRSTSFWANETISPRFDEGRYEFFLSNSEKLTLNIGNAYAQPIPLPAGLPLLVGGLGAMVLVRRFRKSHA